MIYLKKRKAVPKGERGYLIVEVLMSLTIFSSILLILLMSYGNTSPSRTILQLSQDFQLREYTKLYRVIAPSVAETLSVGETVIFEVNSPNYLSANGKKYINLFENYQITQEEKQREGLTNPLVIYNTLHNMTNFTVTRSGINTYAGNVKFTYYYYKEIQQFQYALDLNNITMVQKKDFALFSRGIPKEYQFSMTGEIVKQPIKQ